MSDLKSGMAPIFIRRVVKKQAASHHGGAWKVAYADFVTAMMAFFLVMWLVGTTSKIQKGAIAEYFKNPSMQAGHSVVPSQSMGPGGQANSMIAMANIMTPTKGDVDSPLSRPQPVDSKAREIEKKRLDELMKQLKSAIESSQALAPFKNQLLLDITSEGLRIQIVDEQSRPMFDLGSSELKGYTAAILRELAVFINGVPNRISITGHTDDTPYSGNRGYSNWELSADRANAARRALIAGGMEDAKIARVVGLSSSVLFKKDDPRDPSNRRISIVVMNHDADVAADAKEQKDAPPAEPIEVDAPNEAPPPQASAVDVAPSTPAEAAR